MFIGRLLFLAMMNYIIQKLKSLIIDHLKLINKKYKQNRLINFTIPMKLTNENQNYIFLVLIVGVAR